MNRRKNTFHTEVATTKRRVGAKTPDALPKSSPLFTSTCSGSPSCITNVVFSPEYCPSSFFVYGTPRFLVVRIMREFAGTVRRGKSLHA